MVSCCHLLPVFEIYKLEFILNPTRHKNNGLKFNVLFTWFDVCVGRESPVEWFIQKAIEDSLSKRGTDKLDPATNSIFFFEDVTMMIEFVEQLVVSFNLPQENYYISMSY